MSGKGAVRSRINEQDAIAGKNASKIADDPRGMNRHRIARGLFRVLQARCGKNASEPLLAGGPGCFQSGGQTGSLTPQPLEIGGAIRDNPEAGSVLPDDRGGEIHNQSVGGLDVQRPMHGIPLIETGTEDDQQIRWLIGQCHPGMVRPGVAENPEGERMIFRKESLGAQRRCHGEIPSFRKATQEAGPLGVLHPRSDQQDNFNGWSSRRLAGQVRERSFRC